MQQRKATRENHTRDELKEGAYLRDVYNKYGVLWRCLLEGYDPRSDTPFGQLFGVLGAAIPATGRIHRKRLLLSAMTA